MSITVVDQNLDVFRHLLINFAIEIQKKVDKPIKQSFSNRFC